jgi:uncharacterized protein YfaP (DUF2135 family)
MRRYRPIRTGPQIPFPIGLAIASAVLVVGILTVFIGSGLVIDVASGFAGAVHDAFAQLTSEAPATAAPSGVQLSKPTLTGPGSDPYTNQPVLVLHGTVPPGTVDKAGYKVRVYTLGDNGARTLVAEVPVGGTTHFTTPDITMAEGTNTYVATLVAPSGEGEASDPISFILDTKPPTISITSPAKSATLNAGTVTISGKTDAGVALIVRNEQVAGGAATPATADGDGKFSASVPIIAGPNTIDITGTDQAGNSATTSLTVERAYGQLAAHLAVSPSKFSSGARTTLKLTLHATSFNGGPLADASVTFTVLVQGLGPIESPTMTTDATGTAVWQIDISGAVEGSGQASVLVTSPAGDVVTATASIVTT